MGISAYYHDSAAALIKDGLIVCAAQEERFTRKKHDPAFPNNAIKFCCDNARIDLSEISLVVFYEKPFLKFERLLETYLSIAPRGFISFKNSMPLWIKEKIFQKQNIHQELSAMDPKVDWKTRLRFSGHHLSHAASAFFPSPFDNATVVTVDGVGEWCSTGIFEGEGHKLSQLKSINFPHSLGLLYSAFTFYTGFKVNSGEYKLMGLAPYGTPKYKNIILDNLIETKSDGSFRLNMKYFDFASGLKMTNHHFASLFGGDARTPESEITQREMDIAASIQVVTEEVMLNLVKHAQEITGRENLCLAGGVALNCVANGKFFREGIFKNIWIQPPAGDAGGALGAALAVWHIELKKNRVTYGNTDSMKGTYLGPQFCNKEIEKELSDLGATFKKHSTDKLIEIVANELAEGKAVGWMQGRMEFGPRALGARSILADPRQPDTQKKLNLKIKYRESFRPFAPSVLEEYVSSWFDLDNSSPYMLIVADIVENKRRVMKKEETELFGIERLNVARSLIPAVTHVNYTARIQTVSKHTNPKYHKLLQAFHKITGVPILVNTSFNVRSEPIVCTPKDAWKCFMGTELDVLVIEDIILYKKDQDKLKVINYREEYELD